MRCRLVKRVSRSNVVYSFSPRHKPVERVALGERVLLETEDALGGQVRDESTLVKGIDWSKVNGVTGPIFVDGVKPGDALIVNVEDVRIAESGVIVVVPKQGALRDKAFSAAVKVVHVRGGYLIFEDGIKVRVKPAIGTLGVAPPSEEVPTGNLGRHGGNVDVKDVGIGAKLYIPVFVEGALFAAGDLHAVQADGEACVSAAEVQGEVILSFNVIRGRSPPWPILETKRSYAILTCGNTLDEACAFAVEAAVNALMKEHDLTFEKAYMLVSLAVDLKINQVVDPKMGVRAVIPKRLISVDSLCYEEFTAGT